MRTFWAIALGVGLLTSGCGRYFAGPVRPVPESEQLPHMSVRDDGAVVYSRDRLEIVLRPLTDPELNRAFASNSAGGARSTNPYTFGDWTPLGDDHTPPRFTVFLLHVKNYAYPKVRIDPSHIELTSSSHRTYEALAFMQLDEYYRAHAQAWAGNAYKRYSERRDLLRRTLYSGDMVFSGQEDQGYVVFPPLAPDVTDFVITVPDIALRFDYAGRAVESLDLAYHFQRDVQRGYSPPRKSLVVEQ